MNSSGCNVLTRLAPELQHMIFDHLLPSHEPDKAFESEHPKSPGNNAKKPCTHPLDYLAATCKAIRDEVNEWALHFLARHRGITKYRPYKTNRIQQRRDFLRGKHGLLTWMEKHCVFCGNKSSRSAILMNGLRCCAKCDKEQWPDKITKTEARMKYDLKDWHLLPSSTVSPTAVKMLEKHPGLPKVRYGTYMISNVLTTMFLRKDVESLAKLAHGDLKVHLANRQADRDERRKKAKETKARKDAEAAEAERERQKQADVAELMWTYKHKHHSITCYGSEDGPVSPPPIASSPGKREHRKTLSIDSNAANEGRVVTPPPPPPAPREPSPRPEPEVMRVTNYALWDGLPSMFGMSQEEWDAVIPSEQSKSKVETPVKQPLPTTDVYGPLDEWGFKIF